MVGDRLRRLSRTPAAMVTGRFGAIVFAFVSVTIVARELGPTGRGVTAGMLSALTIAPIVLGTGVPLAVRRRVAVGEVREHVLATARTFTALTLAPAVLCGFGLDLWLFHELTFAQRLVFQISMASTPLAISWAIDLNALLADLRYGKVGALSVIQPATNCIALLVVALLDSTTVESVMYAALGSNVLAFALGRAWVGGPWIGRAAGLGDLSREGATLVGGRIAEVASRRVDQVVALPLLGAAGAGIYSIGVTVGALSLPLSQSIGAAAFRDLSTEEPAPLGRAMREATALAIMSSAALGAAAWFAIPVVFGPAYAPSRPVALVAIAGSAIASVSFVASMALAARRRGKPMTWAQVTGIVLALALFVPLASAWGPVGGAIAMAIGSVATLAGLMWALRLSPYAIAPRPGDFGGAIRTLFGG